MKAIFLVFLLLPTLLYSQNGTYKCSLQRYSTVDKTKDETYRSNQLITINLNDLSGGDIIITKTSEDVLLKYTILPNEKKTYTDKNDRTITHTYLAKLVLNNVEMDESLLVGIEENMDNSNLRLWVYSEKYQAYNHYLNLIKFKF